MVDFSCYVMTSEFGAQSQLEKIDMLDYAELVILNKFDRRAAEDALREREAQFRSIVDNSPSALTPAPPASRRRTAAPTTRLGGRPSHPLVRPRGRRGPRLRPIHRAGP